MEDKLKALSRSQQTETTSTPESPRPDRLKRWLFRIAPWVLFTVFLIILAFLFGDRLLPAVAVEVEPVVTLAVTNDEAAPVARAVGTGSQDAYAGATLFQASGWFEADPYPYRATALASGVVETVHVLEGQSVQSGDPIATLVREDAALRLRMAEASLEAVRAALESASSETELAHARVESMRRQIEVAEARREELTDLADRARELGAEVLAEQEISQSILRLNTQEQEVAALVAQLREREIETERLAGQLQMRESQVGEAEVRLGEAKLEYDRMVIRAPVDGIIQRLMVSPGQKKVLMADHPESATVALLFQPESLQARIDVPIAEASRLAIGQAVLVESEFLPGSELRGYVQRIVGEADLQRNTLQVKVRIEDPPPGLRPEILCRAQFLDSRFTTATDGPMSPVSGPAEMESAGRLRILAPRSALFDINANRAAVWVVGPSGRHAELRQLLLGEEERDGYVWVREGLRPGDRVVVQSSADLRDGKRIQI